MDTLESISTQLHDMDKSNEEDKLSFNKQLQELSGRVGVLESGVKQILTELSQLKRIAKDAAFDTQQAVKEVNKTLGEVTS